MIITLNGMDALVLSVIYEQNKLDIVKWIAMIDFYERIIITLDELNDSLEKLQKCGFIMFSNDEFILTPEVANLFPKKFNIRNYEKIYNKLLEKEYIERANSSFKLSNTEYAEALNRYKNMIKCVR